MTNKNIFYERAKNETYYFAKASGDRTYIEWLKTRLIHVYGESRFVDFVHALDEFAKAGERVKQLEEENRKLKEALNAY